MGTFDYYTTLVRLAPAAVAKSAVRRVQGVARQALYRRRYRVDELRLLQAYGAGSAEELAGKLLETRHTSVWCEHRQRASVLEALAAVPGARERALRAGRGGASSGVSMSSARAWPSVRAGRWTGPWIR